MRYIIRLLSTLILLSPLQVTLATPLNSAQINIKDSSSYLNLLSILHKNKSISTGEYEQLRQEHLSAQEQVFDDEEDNDLSIKTTGGLEVATYDGKHSFEISGRLMYDLVAFEENKNKLGDGTGLRRAFLGVKGQLNHDWGYSFTTDFSTGEADIKNAYIHYSEQQKWLFKFGSFKEPFSLSELTSSKYTTFLERPQLTELAPGRSVGIGINHYGRDWTVAASLTGDARDSDPDDEGDEGWGSTVRSTYAPWHGDTQALHFGLALAHRVTDADHQVKFDSRPETKHTSLKFLNTGKIAQVKETNTLGLEAAWVEGPASLQAEYAKVKLEREAASALSFESWYVMGSWVLTGESRNYKFKKGSFGRLKPYSSAGAWELALRYSTLDLTDGDILGGRDNISSLAINWYINKRIRTAFNYALVNNDKNANDNGDVIANDDVKYAQLRLQIDF